MSHTVFFGQKDIDIEKQQFFRSFTPSYKIFLTAEADRRTWKDIQEKGRRSSVFWKTEGDIGNGKTQFIFFQKGISKTNTDKK